MLCLYFEFILPFIKVKAILAFITITLLSFHLKRRKNLPPGPRSIPLLGNLPILAINSYRTGKEPTKLLTEMAKKYGEVFSLKIGTKLMVVVNGCGSIKEAFKNQHMNDRPESDILKETEFDEAIGNASGKLWKYQRTFILSAFRTFGVGRSRFEGNIIKEAETLVDEIRAKKDTPFDPHVLVGNCISNIICSVVFGKRYDHSDPEFKRLALALSTLAADVGSGASLVFLPFAKYIFPRQYKNAISDYSVVKQVLQRHADDHQRNFDQNNIKDIIDVFLSEIDLVKKENDDRLRYINLKTLTSSAIFLFFSGSETSVTTLRWTLLYMMTYPEIQAKVQQEIDAVTGRMRMPQWADRLSLPFTEAVLMEIQRIRTVVPLGIPHVASADTKLAGYDIPEGSFIVSNIWALHNDPDVWAEPEQFKPERFLDEDGKLRHREEFMTFSTGHRVCLGENLAKMEIFLFFTYILHSFTLGKPSEMKAPSMEGISGVTFSPRSYELIAKNRK
ncbi:cytochrome P450 2J6-like [Amphiura filiformis]|uniref:cytochrome P450 2J6-like n=1 Tax=Amphiura filiformis TaxID=82378 RepID=UPI003B21D148